MAQIRRDTLEPPHCEGDIALVNIKLKLKAFLVRHIVRFLQDDFHPWKVFARYCVGLQLKYYKTEVFLPGPHSESEMPEFYSVCLGLFRYFCRSFPDVPLDQLTVKRIYQLLIDKNFERPHVEYYIALPCQKVGLMYNCIWRPYIGQLERDVAYRGLHGGLATKDRLYMFGISRCRLCCLCWAQKESYTHVFINCSVLQDVLQVLDVILFGLCNHRLKMDLASVRFNSV